MVFMDRRNFVITGAAAGVCTENGAESLPLEGLLDGSPMD